MASIRTPSLQAYPPSLQHYQHSTLNLHSSYYIPSYSSSPSLPMPSQCTAPRPILKTSSRKSSTSSTSSLDSFPTPPPTPSSSKGPCVQFSQCLSTTYLAYSSVDYNRSPITVTPNTCALPSRGRCNGSSSSNEEGVALRQFRLEAEGRPVPALIHDDGDSSSEESDVSIPNPKQYTQQYTIPSSLLKSRRNSNSRPASSRPRPSHPSPYPSYAPAYSISESSEAYGAERDDIFGGF